MSDLNLVAQRSALETFTDAYCLPPWHLELAVTTLSVIPRIVVQVVAQRQVVESLAMPRTKA